MIRTLALTLAAALVAVAAAIAPAAEKAPAAEPALKALIVDGQNNHAWQATTPLLKAQLEQTGLFKVDVATSPEKGQDMSGFKPDFAAYNVVVSNYNGDDWPEETRKALVDYMQAGGGLVIVHAADNAFAKWPEWNEMIGVGGWGGRNEKDGPYLRWRDGQVVRDMTPGGGGSHGSQHPFPINVREAEHPVTKGLPPVFMHSKEELYNRMRGPAKNLTVLATALSPKDKGGSGEEEPVLMTIQYGKGRVFHTVLGHAAEQMKSVAFIVTYQRGAEWAATGKVTQKVPDDFPTADKDSRRE
jgi:type 1 glutamine amidotransferase